MSLVIIISLSLKGDLVPKALSPNWLRWIQEQMLCKFKKTFSFAGLWCLIPLAVLMSENKQMQSFSPVNYKKGQGPLLHGTVGITRRAAEHASCSKIKEKLLSLSVFLSFYFFFLWTAAFSKRKTFGFSFLQLKAFVNNCKNDTKSTQVLSLSLTSLSHITGQTPVTTRVSTWAYT